MRKGPQKTFKVRDFFMCVQELLGARNFYLIFHCCLQGSIFAVLESEEAAKAFVERADVKEYKGNEMIVMMK